MSAGTVEPPIPLTVFTALHSVTGTKYIFGGPLPPPDPLLDPACVTEIE